MSGWTLWLNSQKTRLFRPGAVTYDLIISIYSDDPTKCPKCNREYYFKQFAKVYIKEKQTMKVKVRDRIYDGEEEPVMVILSEDEKEQIANMSSANSKYCVYPDKKEWIANNFEGIKKWMNEPIIFTLPKKRD